MTIVFEHRCNRQTTSDSRFARRPNTCRSHESICVINSSGHRGFSHKPKNDPFSELPSGHFFRWPTLNRWRQLCIRNSPEIRSFLRRSIPSPGTHHNVLEVNPSLPLANSKRGLAVGSDEKRTRDDDVSPTASLIAASGRDRWIVAKTVPATFRLYVPDFGKPLLDIKRRKTRQSERLCVEHGRVESTSHKLLIRRS
jgi:hypothetical protein